MNNKNGNRIFWISLIFVAIGMISIAASSFRSERPVEPKELISNDSRVEKPEASTAPKNNYQHMYKPSDIEVQKAIESGKHEAEDGTNYFVQYLDLPVAERKLSGFFASPKLKFFSPRAKVSARGYENPYVSVKEARKEIKDREISILVTFDEDSYDESKAPVIELSQGANRITPTSKELNFKSTKDGRKAAYVLFSASPDIDFDLPARVYIRYGFYDDYISYDLDFDRFIF